MNAVAPETIAPVRVADLIQRSADDTRASAPSRFDAWPQLAIITAFWVYVIFSNLLYAKGMSGSLDPQGTGHLFAGWEARVLQHLFLYPILLACLWGAVRTGWSPAWRAVPTQLLLGVAFAACASPLLVMGEYWASPSSWNEHVSEWHASSLFERSEIAMWIASATSFFLTYGFALALISGFTLYRRYRDSEVQLQALERAWSGARLAALRMQLSPHTLFNLLHTIRGQIGWDPAAAQSMIVSLGDLLRRLLTAGEREFSSLTDEMQFARLYLDLQQQRFADRLTVSLPAADELPQQQVPSLILQPLIENAVVHGLAGHDGLVNIEVQVSAEPNRLRLRVSNDMANGSHSSHNGIGLKNVRERLSVQFGDRASFRAGREMPRLWVAEICLPLPTETLRTARSVQ